MPNMDGTGPRYAGQGMSRGNGRRGGAGRGFSGCRCGFGSCAPFAHDERTTLEAHKNALKRRLDSIEKRLEML